MNVTLADLPERITQKITVDPDSGCWIWGGGANPGGMRRVHEHFGVFVPMGQAINPITKTNWEGVGVEPDVKVSAADALATAQALASKELASRRASKQ